MKSEKRNKRMNNKGFSLVELIVVMAIMAILAVTLAPKLTHYVEKAKLQNDRDVVNAVYNSAKLAMVDETLLSGFEADGNKLTATSGKVYYAIDLSTLYTKSSSNSWTAGSSTDAFKKEIQTVVGNFKLKGASASTAGVYVAYSVTDKKLFAWIDYSTTDTSYTADYVDGFYSATPTAPDYKVVE